MVSAKKGDKSKKCSNCHEVKPLSEFHVNSAHKDGLQDRCKPCMNQSVRESRTRMMGGIERTLVVSKLLILQDNKCAACETPYPSDYYIFDKITEKFLCKDCNRLLKLVDRDPDVLARLIKYIEGK